MKMNDLSVIQMNQMMNEAFCWCEQETEGCIKELNLLCENKSDERIVNDIKDDIFCFSMELIGSYPLPQFVSKFYSFTTKDFIECMSEVNGETK